MEINRIHHGDCLELMHQIKDKSVDMILCDLPYGTTRNKWDSVINLEYLWKHYNRIIKDSGVIVLTAQTPFDKVLGESNLKMLKYEWIWVKPQGTGFLNAKKMPLKATENILVFYKKTPTYNPQMRTGFKPYRCKQGSHGGGNYGKKMGEVITESNGERYPLNWLEFNYDKEKLHPTQKPLELGRYFVRTYTNEGDLVLDNTCGCGTFPLSAKLEGRNYIGIELDEKYWMTAEERCELIRNNKSIQLMLNNAHQKSSFCAGKRND